MKVRCRVCRQIIRKRPKDHTHTLNPSPVGGALCLGCWAATVELEKFLFRATKHTPMGNWTEGWLRAIIKEPTKYRE